MNSHSTVQFFAFPDGGFVLHRITGDFSGRCSAWFDASGKLLDAEQILGLSGPVRSVRKNGPIWQHLQTVGARYVGLARKA